MCPIAKRSGSSIDLTACHIFLVTNATPSHQKMVNMAFGRVSDRCWVKWRALWWRARERIVPQGSAPFHFSHSQCSNTSCSKRTHPYILALKGTEGGTSQRTLRFKAPKIEHDQILTLQLTSYENIKLTQFKSLPFSLFVFVGLPSSNFLSRRSSYPISWLRLAIQISFS